MNTLVTASIGKNGLLWGAVLSGTLALAFYVGLVALAGPLLTVRSEFTRTDYIVVLGGDGPSRAARAADLWLMGMAPRVLVSGDGDCLHIRDAMVAAGVPRAVIATECLSGSTRENAQFSAILLAKAEIGSATIVTNWFHSRRAVASFTRACPRIAWLSSPTEPASTLLKNAFSHHGPAIAQEYAKLLVYALGDLARNLQGKRGPAGWCAGEQA